MTPVEQQQPMSGPSRSVRVAAWGVLILAGLVPVAIIGAIIYLATRR